MLRGMDGSAQSSKPEAVKAQRRKCTMAEMPNSASISIRVTNHRTNKNPLRNPAVAAAFSVQAAGDGHAFGRHFTYRLMGLRLHFDCVLGDANSCVQVAILPYSQSFRRPCMGSKERPLST